MSEPDAAYPLDFFSHITDIHFSSMWLEVSVSNLRDVDGSSQLQCSVDFANQAGGTPGYQLFGPGPVFNSRFLPLPKRITTALLTQGFRPDAGADFVGFGVRNLLVSPFNSTILASVWLQCGAHGLLDKTILVRLNYPISPSGTNIGCTVALHSKAPTIKQTLQIGPSPPPDNNPGRGVKISPAPKGDPVAFDFQNPSGHTATYDWIVNVPKKTISFAG